jgi:elongation factor 3
MFEGLTILFFAERFSQVIISHNHEFVGALCPEIWNIEAGKMTHQGKAAVVDDAFLDGRSPRGSGSNTPARSRHQTPAVSVNPTPVGSGDEAAASQPSTPPIRKKKKMTRNQLKAQEERRRLRKLQWLQTGGPKPEDTDSD